MSSSENFRIFLLLLEQERWLEWCHPIRAGTSLGSGSGSKLGLFVPNLVLHIFALTRWNGWHFWIRANPGHFCLSTMAKLFTTIIYRLLLNRGISASMASCVCFPANLSWKEVVLGRCHHCLLALLDKEVTIILLTHHSLVDGMARIIFHLLEPHFNTSGS